MTMEKKAKFGEVKFTKTAKGSVTFRESRMGVNEYDSTEIYSQG